MKKVFELTIIILRGGDHGNKVIGCGSEQDGGMLGGKDAVDEAVNGKAEQTTTERAAGAGASRTGDYANVLEALFVKELVELGGRPGVKAGGNRVSLWPGCEDCFQHAITIHRIEGVGEVQLNEYASSLELGSGSHYKTLHAIWLFGKLDGKGGVTGF